MMIEDHLSQSLNNVDSL